MDRLSTSYFGEPEEQPAAPYDQWLEGLIDLNELPPEDQERARALLATGDWEEVEPDPEDGD